MLQCFYGAIIAIEFSNENITEETPALGVSHVVARTTRGNFCDPSVLIRNSTQFKKLRQEFPLIHVGDELSQILGCANV